MCNNDHLSIIGNKLCMLIYYFAFLIVEIHSIAKNYSCNLLLLETNIYTTPIHNSSLLPEQNVSLNKPIILN